MKISAPAGSGMPPRKGAVAGLAASIGSSAEAVIAIALVGVCLIVGGTAWVLKLREAPPPRIEAAPIAEAPEPAPASPDQQAAPIAWAEQLEGEVAQIEQQQAESAQPAAEPQRKPAPAQAAAEAPHAAVAAPTRAAPPPAAAPSPTPTPAPAPSVAAAPAATTPVPAAKPGAVAATKPAPAAGGLVRAKLDWASCTRPQYPKESWRKREQGAVVMAFQVDASGKVVDKRVDQRSGSPVLDRTALSAIAKCRFSPAQSNGVAETSWTQVRFVWKLDQ